MEIVAEDGWATRLSNLKELTLQSCKVIFLCKGPLLAGPSFSLLTWWIACVIMGFARDGRCCSGVVNGRSGNIYRLFIV
jgi:hypothetical protein